MKNRRMFYIVFMILNALFCVAGLYYYSQYNLNVFISGMNFIAFLDCAFEVIK